MPIEKQNLKVGSFVNINPDIYYSTTASEKLKDWLSKNSNLLEVKVVSVDFDANSVSVGKCPYPIDISLVSYIYPLKELTKKDLEKMPLEDILSLIEGINLRQVKTNDYATLDAIHYDESKGDIKFINKSKYGEREMIKRPNEKHKLEGKWLCQIVTNTSSTVSWSMVKNDNVFVGDTAKEALIKCYLSFKNRN